MFKLFSIEEATKLLPFVDETLRDMQQNARDLMALRAKYDKVNAWSVTARNLAEEIKFLIGAMQSSKAELDRRGIQLRDIETGVVDFPSRIGAEVVCLCWEQGEDAIAYYHRLNDDTTRRRPIEAHPQVTEGTTEDDAVLTQVAAHNEAPETPATPS